MTEHTPGPWRWYWREEADIKGDIADCGVFHEKHPGHAYAIARCPQYENREQWEANARLIAAAPDLLQALKGAAEVIDACVRNTATVPIPGISRIMRAAIAKAEGK